ncbi:hypothetical protein RND71_030766 [Anisodus tanguticus]|uniref:Uncharacterized protein n=1 Tax=Anisodus tanguticus TaxID=243964 RepID=A0AAE1RI68_9SOLA|nr:hypothetical protein RND71_030766 [Anisodus tanguticus]
MSHNTNSNHGINRRNHNSNLTNINKELKYKIVHEGHDSVIGSLELIYSDNRKKRKEKEKREIEYVYLDEAHNIGAVGKT